MKKSGANSISSLLSEGDNSDLNYLSLTNLSDVLPQALASINKLKPSDPTEYLGRWLLNHEEQFELKEQVIF